MDNSLSSQWQTQVSFPEHYNPWQSCDNDDISMNRYLGVPKGNTGYLLVSGSTCPLFLLLIHRSDLISLQQLVKTHDLSPKHNYIIANHPHGIVSYGVFINFATEATGFARIFPAITPSVGTLEWIFWIPIVRDYVMSMGEYKKSFHSLTYLRALTPISPDSPHLTSCLEEDLVEYKSRTHWASNKSMWPRIRF